MTGRERLLAAALEAVLPLAESRVEDLSETPDAGWFRARAIYEAATKAAKGGEGETAAPIMPAPGYVAFVEQIARLSRYEEGREDYGDDGEATVNALIGEARALLGWADADGPAEDEPEPEPEIGRDEASAKARDEAVERILTPEVRCILGLLAWDVQQGSSEALIFRHARRLVGHAAGLLRPGLTPMRIATGEEN